MPDTLHRQRERLRQPATQFFHLFSFCIYLKVSDKNHIQNARATRRNSSTPIACSSFILEICCYYNKTVSTCTACTCSESCECVGTTTTAAPGLCTISACTTISSNC